MVAMISYSNADIVVLGSGLAGLYAAINCKLHGLDVTLCSKSNPGTGSCTSISKGRFRTSSDTFPFDDHKRHTFQAGKYIN